MSEPASFDFLLDEVLADWPSELRIGELDWSDTGKHYIFGLNRLAIRISSSYMGRQDEILMRTMSDAVLDGVHGFAVFCDPVRPALLRRDYLKRRFDARLRGSVLIGSGLRWSEEDIVLAQAYLDAQTENKGPEYRDTPSTRPSDFLPMKGVKALTNWVDGSIWEDDTDSSLDS